MKRNPWQMPLPLENLIVYKKYYWSIFCYGIFSGFWYGFYFTFDNMEADFCVETLRRVLSNEHCDIFNTDQGSQFTCHDFTELLKQHHIKISMDGKGRALDNVFVERLWRSVKYECVYLQDWRTVKEACSGLKEYFEFYNFDRPHQSLDGQTPAEVYYH